MRYRLLAVPVIGAVLVLAGFLIIGSLNQNLVYYLTPREAVSQRSSTAPDTRLRLGGLVEKGSVVSTATGVDFTLSGGGGAVRIVYEGVPAQLFAAGIGAVVEGSWRGERFAADTIIVKHDENYSPPKTAASGAAGKGAR